MFTKFSIILMFAMAYFFGYFLFRLSRKPFWGLALTLLVSAGLVFSTRPMFQGQLISPVVRRNLPNEYLEIFDWFKGRDGRIAALPLNTLWGWDYHSWKYEGSGFLTYGLENPLLLRDFDRWSKCNEGFYNEAAHALYADNNEALARVLKKYQVKYLLLDESVINAGGSREVLHIRGIKDMLANLGISEAAKFNFLTVYDTRVDTENISAPATYTKVHVNLDYAQVDPVYQKYGDYIEFGDGIGFPFVNFDARGDIEIRMMNNELRIMNERTNSEVILPVKDVIKEDFGKDRGFSEGYNCDLKKLGGVQKTLADNGIVYKAMDGGVSCDFFEYPDLKYNQAYVLRIKGENKEGRSLKIYLQNWETNRMDLEELLPGGQFDNYYFIYPQNSINSGYSLNLETRSFGRIASENVISGIEFYPVDYKFLSEVYTGNGGQIIGNNLKVKNTKKYGTAFYKINVEGSGLMQLGQGYEKGWIAFSMVNGQWSMIKHIKLNGWSNGWLIENLTISHQPLVIYVVFWPQLLEWGGMVLGVITILTLVRIRLK